MDTPKQTVSVLFIFFFISILCFSNKFDLSSIVYLLSDINELINRRNMVLLCHIILLFIVKDSGLLNLSSPQGNEFSEYKEKRVVPLEKEHEFEAKEVRLEREEEIGGSYIGRSLDMVVMEKGEEVIERNGEEELEEEQMEVMESNGEEEPEEVMERSEGEWELVNQSVGGTERTGEEELEKESVEELNRKIDEFIEKFKRERSLETMEQNRLGLVVG